MTEMIKKTEASGPPKRYALDPVAFFKALILTPFIVAAAGFWALFIPVFAVVFGGPIYLVFGTPILMIYLHYRVGSAYEIAMLAFATTAVGALILMVTESVFAWGLAISGVNVFVLIALAMAPIWGVTFGYFYNRWRSTVSRQPLPPLA